MLELLEKIEKAEVYQLPLEKISPNSWNPNEMQEKAWVALGESIRKYGIHLQPLVVRPLENECFQIIDGEHRYRWACEMGLPAVSVVIVDAGDNDAKKLTQILNRTRGEDNPVKLKELLDSLLVDLSPREVIEGLPIDSEGELGHILDELEKEIMSDYDPPAEASAEEDDTDEEKEPQHRCPMCGFEF